MRFVYLQLFVKVKIRFYIKCARVQLLHQKPQSTLIGRTKNDGHSRSSMTLLQIANALTHDRVANNEFDKRGELRFYHTFSSRNIGPPSYGRPLLPYIYETFDFDRQ